MNIELLPSGKKHTNALILALANMSFNLLRIIGQSSLKVRKELKEDINVKRIRLKTVIRDYINVACDFPLNYMHYTILSNNSL